MGLFTRSIEARPALTRLVLAPPADHLELAGAERSPAAWLRRQCCHIKKRDRDKSKGISYLEYMVTNIQQVPGELIARNW